VSNRLNEIGRVPLMPDPLVALQTSNAISLSQNQTEQVLALGRAFRDMPKDIWNAVSGCAKAIEEATRIRDLASMEDSMLSDIGLRRDQVPHLFVNHGVDRFSGSFNGRGGSIW